MADLRNGCPTDLNVNEAVCIDAGRVYDSCCDRDCLEDLRCFFLPETQALINHAKSVRLRSAEVLNVFIDVEPVNFNRGFFSCDLTFFFLLSFDLYTSAQSCPKVINGIATSIKTSPIIKIRVKIDGNLNSLIDFAKVLIIAILHIC